MHRQRRLRPQVERGREAGVQRPGAPGSVGLARLARRQARHERRVGRLRQHALPHLLCKFCRGRSKSATHQSSCRLEECSHA